MWPLRQAFFHSPSGVSVHDSKLRDRKAVVGVVLVYNLDALPDVVDVTGLSIAYQLRANQRDLVRIDQGVDVRDLVLEARVESGVMDVEGEQLACAFRRLPIHITRERLVIVLLAIGLGPVGLAGGLAPPDQKLVLLEPLPKSPVVMIEARPRLLPFGRDRND